MQVSDPLREHWDELVQHTHQELERVVWLKMVEWNCQVHEVCSSRETSSCPGIQAVQVNTGEINIIFSVAWLDILFLDTYFQFGSGSLHPAVAAAMFLVLSLMLLCGVSHKQAGFTLMVLKQMIHWLSEGNGQPEVDTAILPRDPQTLLQFFDLNP